MLNGKYFAAVPEIDPELQLLIEESKRTPASEEDLREQRISFAYGNALDSERITKEFVRQSAENIRLNSRI